MKKITLLGAIFLIVLLGLRLAYSEVSAGTYVKDIRAPTFVIAAHDSINKEDADFICDGIDDQEEIQLAIDLAPPIGAIIDCKAGTYHFSGTLWQNKASTFIRGQGTNTIFRLDDNVNEDMIVFVYPAWNSGISNLKIDGNRENQTSEVAGIKTSNVCYFWIEDCLISSLSGAGIHFSGAEASGDFFVESNYIEKNKYGIHMDEDSHDLFLIGNGIEENLYGVYFTPNLNGYSVETHIIGNGFALAGGLTGGIIIYSATELSNLIVSDNLFEDSPTGADNYIDISDSYNLTFTNNIFKNAFCASLVLRNCRDGVISGNVFMDSSRGSQYGHSAIHLQDTTDFIISSNRAYDSQDTKSQRSGLRMVGSSDYCIITNNNFRGNGLYGMEVVGTNNEIAHNIE